MTPESEAHLSADTVAEGALRAERFVLLTVTLGTMLAPLNSTMIAVAMPDIMQHFGVGIASAGWLITAYLVGMASLLPVAGKIGDMFGRRRFVLGGLALFGVASLAAAAAPNLSLLLFFRVLQAVAGALIVPNCVALLRVAVPEVRRGRSFGLLGAGIALAAGLGPPIGGALVEAGDWRAIFFVNIVLVIPALILGWHWLPRTAILSQKSKFDLAGAIMLPALLVLSAMLLMSIGRETSVAVLVGGSIAAVTIAGAFALQEFRHPDPVVQPRLFRRRAFAAANGGIAFANLAMYTLLLSLPLLLADRSGSSPLQTGMVLAALSASMIVLAPVGGRLADRFGRRLPTTAGLAVLTSGALVVAVGGAGISLVILVVGLILVGSGLAVATPGLQTTAVEAVDPLQAGVASGVYSTSRYLGSILGSAIMAGLLGTELGDTTGIGSVFLIVFVAAVLATAASLGMQARPEVGRDDVNLAKLP